MRLGEATNQTVLAQCVETTGLCGLGKVTAVAKLMHACGLGLTARIISCIMHHASRRGKGTWRSAQTGRRVRYADERSGKHPFQMIFCCTPKKQNKNIEIEM